MADNVAGFADLGTLCARLSVDLDGLALADRELKEFCGAVSEGFGQAEKTLQSAARSAGNLAIASGEAARESREAATLAQETPAQERELAARRESLAQARILAVRAMYKDLKGESGRYYQWQRDLLARQYAEYADLVEDRALLDEWYASQLKDLAIEAARYSDDFMAGVRAGFLDLEDAFATFGEAGYDLVVDFACSSSRALSRYFFDVIKGEAASLGDFFQSVLDSTLRSLSDSLASLVIGSFTSGFGGVLNSAGLGGLSSIFGGGSAASGALEAGFTEGGSAFLSSGGGSLASSLYAMAAPVALAAGGVGLVSTINSDKAWMAAVPVMGSFYGLGESLGLWGDDYVETSQSYGNAAYSYTAGSGLASNINLAASYGGDYEAGGIAVAQTNNAMNAYANAINATIGDIMGALPSDIAAELEATLANSLYYAPPQVELNAEGTGPWNAGNLNQIAYAMDQTLRQQLASALDRTIGDTLGEAAGSIVSDYADVLEGSAIMDLYDLNKDMSLLSNTTRDVFVDISEFASVWGEIQAAISDTVGDVSAIQDELQAVNDQFNAYREAVADFGLNAEAMAQIEAARSQEFLDVIEQAASSYRDAWQGFLDNVMFSDLAPVQSAEGVVGRYEELLASAKTGDVAAYQELLSFVQSTYLPFAQAYSGEGSVDYAQVYNSLIGMSGELTNMGVDLGAVTDDDLAASISAALAPYLQNQDGEMRIVLQIGTETFDELLIDRLSGSTQVVDAVTGIVRSVN